SVIAGLLVSVGPCPTTVVGNTLSQHGVEDVQVTVGQYQVVEVDAAACVVTQRVQQVQQVLYVVLRERVDRLSHWLLLGDDNPPQHQANAKQRPSLSTGRGRRRPPFPRANSAQ